MKKKRSISFRLDWTQVYGKHDKLRAKTSNDVSRATSSIFLNLEMRKMATGRGKSNAVFWLDHCRCYVTFVETIRWFDWSKGTRFWWVSNLSIVPFYFFPFLFFLFFFCLFAPLFLPARARFSSVNYAHPPTKMKALLGKVFSFRSAHPYLPLAKAPTNWIYHQTHTTLSELLFYFHYDRDTIWSEPMDAF